MHHVSDFMQLHGSILMFTQQGWRNTMTKDYFRLTSHCNEQCLVQIIQKQNHIDHLENLGAKHQKRHVVICSNCKATWHNKLTCKAPCSNCGILFKNHLVWNGTSNVSQCAMLLRLNNSPEHTYYPIWLYHETTDCIIGII